MLHFAALPPQLSQMILRKEEVGKNKKESPNGKKLLMSESCCFPNGENCLTYWNTEAI